MIIAVFLVLENPRAHRILIHTPLYPSKSPPLNKYLATPLPSPLARYHYYPESTSSIDALAIQPALLLFPELVRAWPLRGLRHARVDVTVDRRGSEKLWHDLAEALLCPVSAISFPRSEVKPTALSDKETIFYKLCT